MTSGSLASRGHSDSPFIVGLAALTAVIVSSGSPEARRPAMDLEVFATPGPPEDYSLEVEIASVLREADA